MPDESAAFELSPGTVAAVVAHMNADHAADSLAICQRAAAKPRLTEARLLGLDDTGLDFEVVDGATRAPLRILWLRPLRERADIRGQLKEMTLAARGDPAEADPPGPTGSSWAAGD